MPEVRKAIEITGIVQGVGFRPYVYRLASEHALAGNILNTSSGVTIEVQGPRDAVEKFLARVPAPPPPLARITGVQVRDVPLRGAPPTKFEILDSRRDAESRALISPDVAVCDDCLRELFNPADRRYRYPFINCTNCGPRFTIVRGIPYDRGRTSMSVFPMCERCQAEYDDPANRRFHAQPNACWDCGPRVELWDGGGQRIEADDPIAEAARRLRPGRVVAVKGLGGFHLAVDATSAAAVELLRARKRRVGKPFALMVPDVAAAAHIAEIDVAAQAALLSVSRPIVLVPRKCWTPVPHDVAPFNDSLGLFLPYTPLHHLLLAEGGFLALVMTSGNMSEEPIAINNAEAVERLRPLADDFLVHNRDILKRCDDAVVRPSGGRLRQVRRSRGFVPVPVFLRRDLPEVLAVGGELKNTVCLTRGRHAFLSQHIGDLENLEALAFFEEAVAHLKQILEIEPRIVAYDLHPDYLSTQWALRQRDAKLVGVQHHHAHVASCMAENHLEGQVIGIALDGTGYGTDGHIWGGEILVAGYGGFERAAHFEYVPMPGGAAAIREPWRMAAGFLTHHFGAEAPQAAPAFIERIGRRRFDFIRKMVEGHINAPLTSSCGRIFDAVAALAGIRDSVNYEAQAAIELEMAAAGVAGDGQYPFELQDSTGVSLIRTSPMFDALLRDLRDAVAPATISCRFHRGLAAVLGEVASSVRGRTGLNRVCLSGGTFQNVLLAELLETRLRDSGFEVYTHSEVPAGDGGLSLGQAMVAAQQAS